MQRRHFLDLSARGVSVAAAAAGGLGLGSARLWAAPAPPDARFLLVFLRGGYDAMSLLVPAERGFYDELRPNIGIPVAVAAAGAQPAVPGVLPIHADWGLHPALAGSVWPLVARGQASFVPFAGTHNLSRSHFETQDSIELGLPAGLTAGGGDGAGGASAGPRDFQTGFLNRLASQLHGRSAIAFTEQLPLVLRGSLDVANVSLRTPARAGNSAALQDAMQAMYRDHPWRARVAEAFEVREQVAELSREMGAAGRGAISARGFELEARRVARLMRERYALGFVDIGGWDTHVNQGAATGTLANRLEELGRGLAGFADEIGPAAWRSTVVMVVSEFGRTARENGNRGTDHGHGSVYWVLGGGLRGRPVVGEQQPIRRANLFENRDLPVLNDYRGVIGGVLARQFGLGPAAMDKVFAGAQPQDLGLV